MQGGQRHICQPRGPGPTGTTRSQGGRTDLSRAFRSSIALQTPGLWAPILQNGQKIPVVEAALSLVFGYDGSRKVCGDPKD